MPTDAERHDLTGPDTDPQREPEAIERLVAPQSRLHGQGAPPGAARRGDQALVPVTRRPHRQQPVTGEGDHLAPVLGDQRHQLGKIGVEQVRQRFSTGGTAPRQPFRQWREPGDVSEEDCGQEALYPRSIQRHWPGKEAGREEPGNVAPQ